MGKEVDQIAEFLAYLCMNSGSNGIADLVVEARLGKFDELEEAAAVEGEEETKQRFRKDLKKEDFIHILKFLEDDDKERSFNDRTVFTSDDATRGTLHVTFDTQTQECVESRTKTRDYNLDLRTPYLAYDCRINVSGYENESHPKEMPSDYKRKQKIKRWTFYKPRNIWRIDLLEVQSFYTSPRGQRNANKEDGEMEVAAASASETDQKEEEEECNEEGLFPDKRNPIFYISIRLMHDVLTSLVHTDNANLKYIAGKFWQTIQFFAGKSARGGGRRYNNGGNGGSFGSYVMPGGSSSQIHRQGGSNGRRSPYLSPGGGSGGPNRSGGSPRSRSRSPSRSPSLSPFFSPHQWSASPSPHAPASSATPPSPLSQFPSTPFPDVQLQLVRKINLANFIDDYSPHFFGYFR